MVGLPNLLPTALGVARSVACLPFAGTTPAGIGILTLAGARLVNSESETVGELTSAGMATLS